VAKTNRIPAICRDLNRVVSFSDIALRLGQCSPFVLGLLQNSNITGEDEAQMRVLGIDPGLRNMGWGLIDVTGSRLSHVANGICRSAGPDLAARLVTLHDQLQEIMDIHAPDVAAVEQTFVNKDGAGTLKLGQARGVAVLVAARAGLAVGEYAPNAVKKAVVGVGHADKAQIAHMVRLQLPGVDLAGPDAADALAIAICHSHHLQSAGHLSRAVERASA
jgi:crossover junction endodeoxyribonuclease RuvC